jgi:hypothetical protein
MEEPKMNPTTTATATECSAEADLRIQARELLGIAPDATTAQQLQATLEFIDGCDGDLSSAQFDAIELLHGSLTAQDLISGVKLSDFREELEVTLGEEIEQFAGQFFDIPPESRSRAWDSLYQRSEISIALRCRLEGLKAGLLVVPPQLETIADQRQNKLVRTQLALFRQRPTARGPLLIAARQEMSQSPREWSAAVGRFAKTYPDVAKLVPELIDLGESLIRDVQAARKLEKKQRSLASKEARSRFWSGISGGSSWGLVLIVLVGLRFLGGIMKNGDTSPNSRRTSIGSPSGPPISDDARRGLEFVAQMRELQAEIERRKAGQMQSATDPFVVVGHDSDDPEPHPLPPDEPQIDPPAE